LLRTPLIEDLLAVRNEPRNPFFSASPHHTG
jgi:hypothetical protein